MSLSESAVQQYKGAVTLAAQSLPERYSPIQAWLHDYLIAQLALNLHAYLLHTTGLSAILAEPRSRTLLDVGCGGGQSAIRLKRVYPHLAITGVDLSEGQIARARRRAQRAGLDVRFEVADAQALPFADASFDVVFSFGSAKHWPDPRRGLGECWRVLRPGGELLVADATSDATRAQVANFYDVARFPRALRGLVSARLYEEMFRPARLVQIYEQIAIELGMPPGTVSHPSNLPAFLFRTRKPHASPVSH